VREYKTASQAQRTKTLRDVGVISGGTTTSKRQLSGSCKSNTIDFILIGRSSIGRSSSGTKKRQMSENRNRKNLNLSKNYEKRISSTINNIQNQKYMSKSNLKSYF